MVDKVKIFLLFNFSKILIAREEPSIGSVPEPNSSRSTKLFSVASFKIDAIFSARDENLIDKDLINVYLKEDYQIIDNYKDKYFILVDHNNLDNIKKENVIAAIDHHKITNEVEDLIEIEYASTSLLIYDLFKDKYKFSKKEKELIAITVLSDTEYLTSSRFTKEDKKLYDELKVNIDVTTIRNKFFKITDFNKDISINMKEDYKEYDSYEKHFNRCLIKSYSNEKDSFYEEYIKNMDNNNINLLIWCDYEKLKTYVYYNGNNIMYPIFTTSTNLIIEYLYKNKYI